MFEELKNFMQAMKEKMWFVFGWSGVGQNLPDSVRTKKTAGSVKIDGATRDPQTLTQGSALIGQKGDPDAAMADEFKGYMEART